MNDIAIFPSDIIKSISEDYLTHYYWIDHNFIIQVNDGADIMQTVTVSPKYQVVLPKELRKELHIVPGEKFQVFQYDGRIELVPVKDIKKMRGFLKGINTDIERDADRI